MYWRGVSYILHVYTYDLHHNFGRSPTAEKFNPPANFFAIQTLAAFHDLGYVTVPEDWRRALA